jgi:hypothetical protein
MVDRNRINEIFSFLEDQSERMKPRDLETFVSLFDQWEYKNWLSDLDIDELESLNSRYGG